VLSSQFVLGAVKEYIQWDPGRRWIRPKPEYGIDREPGDERIFDQFTTDGYIRERSGFKGKVAYITGIRAAESLIRFRASVNKLNDNYINASSDKRVSLCKPIFDWHENDVFKFFYDHDIPYCPIYDRQVWAGASLRVATPLVAEMAKRFDKLKAVDPTLYQQVIDIFPEMVVQGRYYPQMRGTRTAAVEKYGQSLEGVRAWVEENITDPKHLRMAMKELRDVGIRSRNAPGAYPPDYVLKAFMSGHYKRVIQPLKAKT